MQRLNINIATGETTLEDVADIQPSLDDVRNQKLQQVMDLYKNAIVEGFISNATGTPLFFTYSQQDQLNYNKIATTVALDPTLGGGIQVGSLSGVVTMTRAQYLQFVQDAKTYEYGLYNKRIDLENQIINAVDIQTLNSIDIAF